MSAQSLRICLARARHDPASERGSIRRALRLVLETEAGTDTLGTSGATTASTNAAAPSNKPNQTAACDGDICGAPVPAAPSRPPLPGLATLEAAFFADGAGAAWLVKLQVQFVALRVFRTRGFSPYFPFDAARARARVSLLFRLPSEAVMVRECRKSPGPQQRWFSPGHRELSSPRVPFPTYTAPRCILHLFRSPLHHHVNPP